MASPTNKSLLGKDHLIIEFKQNRPNNNEPQDTPQLTPQRRFNNVEDRFLAAV